MDQIEKQKSQVTEKNLNSSPNCINQSIILAEKKDRICVCLKFDPQSSNSSKLIKLNFILQNQVSTEWWNICLTQQDPHTIA
jgi:hypothetical protein